jgi:hypothetical protein
MTRLLLAALAVLVLALPASAVAADPPPGAAISDNLEYLARVPGTEQVTEGKFDTVGERDVLVITGRFGFKTLDVTNPDAPTLLDTFMPAEIASELGYWQDEDMEIDTRRKLIIGALDPRYDHGAAFSPCPGVGTTRNPGCRSGFYVISYADPADLRQVGDLVELPTGHTSTCIEDCSYVWTGGPARRSDQTSLGPFEEGGRGDGRPIWVTDLRDPENPRTYEEPIDLWRNDGATDYSHDVDVDSDGIAWTSGRGGVLGYATSGSHRDPRTDVSRTARPWDPVLVAGGGVAGTNQPAMFMHNSQRPLSARVAAEGVDRGDVLIATEEEFTSPCETSGRIVISNLAGSWGGEGAAGSTPERAYRMEALDTFHPAQDTPETVNPELECSAHYFELAGSTLGAAWYGQGLRLVDVSDARDVRQVGYFRVTGTDPATNPSSNAWDLAWRGERVYLFDMSRGVEVLRLRGGPAGSSRMASVTAPSVRRDPLASVPVAPADGGPLVCPLFVDVGVAGGA